MVGESAKLFPSHQSNGVLCAQLSWNKAKKRLPKRRQNSPNFLPNSTKWPNAGIYRSRLCASADAPRSLSFEDLRQLHSTPAAEFDSIK